MEKLANAKNHIKKLDRKKTQIAEITSSKALSERPDNQMAIEIPNSIPMERLQQLLDNLTALKEVTTNNIKPFKIAPHHENKLRTLRERQPQTVNSAS